MNFSDTLEKMLSAAAQAAGVHWKDARGYLESEFQQAKQDAADIAEEVIAGTKTKEQAQLELQSIELSLQSVQLALQADAKAAAQDAINAALDVLKFAVNDAVKFPLFV